MAGLIARDTGMANGLADRAEVHPIEFTVNSLGHSIRVRRRASGVRWRASSCVPVAVWLFDRGEPAALGRADASVLSIARAPLTHVAGLVARDAGITAGLADGADLAAGEGGGSGMSGAGNGQRSDEMAV